MVLVEDFNKSAHVRSLEMLGQADIHVEVTNGMLNAEGFIKNLDRVLNPFNSYLIDINLPVV